MMQFTRTKYFTTITKLSSHVTVQLDMKILLIIIPLSLFQAFQLKQSNYLTDLFFCLTVTKLALNNKKVNFEKIVPYYSQEYSVFYLVFI